MSTSSSIFLNVSPTSGGTGIHGMLGSGSVTLWEDVEQTGLTVEGIGVQALELAVGVSGVGANGYLGTHDDIDLEVAVAGTGLHGSLGEASLTLLVAVQGGGAQTSDIRLQVSAQGSGLHGGVGVGSAVLRAQAEAFASGTHEHGAGAAVLRLSAAGEGGLGSFGTGAATLRLRLDDAQGFAGGIGAAAAVLAVSALGQGRADGIGTGAATITVTMRTGATGFGAVGWDEARNVGTGEALVMNAATKALSRYLQFPLNSVALFRGRLVGAGADGVYLLEGVDDAGQPVDAYLQTGDLPLDGEGQCRVHAVHVEYRSSGPMEITVAPDGAVPGFPYRMEETRAEGLYRNRVKVGRGFKAARASVRVANLDGADFALHGLEIDVEAVSRKVS